MLIFQPKYSKKIFYISFLSLIPTILSYYYGMYTIMMMPLSVWITSLNYWRHPIYGWRRNLDISVVLSGVCYQLYYVSSCKYNVYVLTCTFSGTCCYILSWVFTFKKHENISCLFHCGVHLLANLSLLFLITGL